MIGKVGLVSVNPFQTIAQIQTKGADTHKQEAGYGLLSMAVSF